MSTLVDVAQSSVITANAASNSWSLDGFQGIMAVDVVISAVSGAGASLTIQPQVSPDGINWFNEGAASAAQTAPGVVRFSFTDAVEPQARLSFVVAGTTPSFTLSVSAFLI